MLNFYGSFFTLIYIMSRHSIGQTKIEVSPGELQFSNLEKSAKSKEKRKTTLLYQKSGLIM